MQAVYEDCAALSKPRLRRLGFFCALIGFWVIASPARSQEEEAPPIVAEIRIEGNETFGDGELKKLMRTREQRLFQLFSRPRYVRDWLRSDLATLEAHYHRAGFYEVRVSSLSEDDIQFDEDSYSVRILIRVEEGKRRYLRHVSFEPSLDRLEEKLRERLSLQAGKPFDPQAPGMDHFRILQLLQESGYFSARVEHETRILETPAHAVSDSLDLLFRIERGPRARLGEVRLEGNDLPAKVILRELSIRIGEPLLLEDIIDSKQNLFDTGYFRSVDFRIEQLSPGEEKEIEDLRLIWIFRERKMAAAEAGVGVGTVDGLRLLGGWSHRNLLNRGQSMAIEGRVSFNEDRDGDFGLIDEHESIEYRFLRIVRLRASFGLLLFREKDYEQQTGITSLETRAVRLSAARRIDPYTVLRLREQFDFLYQEIIDEELAASEPHTVTRSLTVVLDRDTRSHYFSPSRGGQSFFSYEFAGGIQGGHHHFHRLQWNQSHHQRLGGGVLSSRIYLGGVWAYGRSVESPPAGVPRDGVPFVERFYCGGSATVRGYKENSLGPRLSPADIGVNPDLPNQTLPEGIKGGRYMLVANLEWRFPIRASFGGVFFLDGGNTWLDYREISGKSAFPWQPGDREDLTRVFYGLGIGLRYFTPLTVLRVDFGVPLQVLDNSEGRWHFSLGHTF